MGTNSVGNKHIEQKSVFAFYVELSFSDFSICLVLRQTIDNFYRTHILKVTAFFSKLNNFPSKSGCQIAG